MYPVCPVERQTFCLFVYCVLCPCERDARLSYNRGRDCTVSCVPVGGTPCLSYKRGRDLYSGILQKGQRFDEEKISYHMWTYCMLS